MSERRRRHSDSDSDSERNKKHRRRDEDKNRQGYRPDDRNGEDVKVGQGRERNGDRSDDRRRDRDSHREEPDSQIRRSRSPPSAAVGGPPAPDNADEFAELPKEKPNFALSGKLNAEQNTYKGVVLKYSEPPEARKPSQRWRLYVFKDGKETDILHIHRQSAYLLGRDRLVADIPIDHPSCSKQHAVVQFRVVESKDGGKVVRPYLIDLDSGNGTFLNGEQAPSSRFMELRQGDVIKFGLSTREYVVMKEED
ncbi:Smad nuclear-interacting protein 1 [Gonapodya sp. JEL0774]|nr:Smad nuclear-interacting protein 1 [Gonapodya sp. JEL0774]